MRYIGDIYRPPSEAYSLLVQITVGCSHNKCTFCSMYKKKTFRLRPVNEVMEDLEWARAHYRRVERIFLCDGDALCLTNSKLLEVLDKIKELFPECERVSSYGRTSAAIRKSDAELKELREHGLKMIYLGAESGSDKVLSLVNKGETAEQLIEGVNKLEGAGIKTSVTFIAGLGGRDLMEEHAVQTGKMISRMNASYVSILTLMLEEPAPILKDYKEGRFKLLSPEEVLRESIIMLENAKPEKSCIFRSNHASNYVSLRGNLPEDNEKMIESLKRCIDNRKLIKDELFRML